MPDIRRPLQSVERVRLHLLAYNIQSLSNSHPSKQGQKRTSVQPAQVARQLKSRNPLQAPRQLESRIWVPGCLDLASYHLIFFYRGSTRLQQAATGRHRPPDLLAQNPANLPKSVLPPAQECQIAHLGTLATPVEPRWHQGLPADTKDGQRPPKCDSNSSQICHQAIKKTSIQASKHPSLGSQRSAAEAVAYKSGRGLEGRAHQAACRSPRSGAEAENRGTSSKGFVLILN